MAHEGKMSRFSYALMVWEYRLRDLFAEPDAVLEKIGVQKGFTVADIGCGPGRYIRQASELVGGAGRVFAADIHETAIRIVKRKIKKYGLKNVVPVHGENGLGAIPESSVDAAFALDMFHAVTDPAVFLGRIRRIVRDTGFFILEDGHQPRLSTIDKVEASGVWRIDAENERYLRLIPKQM
ncbi:MAG: class I SAM-dependent methyltransferase [Clostridiales bacterium]|jgi:ubiquinone/menaquinone biosynthesis C-methylase UbiE|nr:class I SAM-dependent methyltransferase [Clostridiales bacterium]